MALVPSNDDDLGESELGLLNLIDELKQLERMFSLDNRFNLFEAVHMTRQEVRHSRFLAFLLNPHGSHGIGDRFLRAVLAATVAEHPNAPISRLNVAIADLSDATVHCERDHFDVTVQLPALKVLFVIENKIGAAESQDQLTTYRKRAEERYRGHRFLGCFLTPDGYEGEDEQWGSMSYTTIAIELKRVIEESSPAPDVVVAIRHYIHLIERKIVASQALIDACKSIYQQHKAALDLIIEHGQESPLAQAFDQFISGEGQSELGLQSMAIRSNTVFFLYEDWLKIENFPTADRKRWTSTFPILLWFEVSGKKLYLRVEVGPLQSSDVNRSTLVNGLREKLGVPQPKSGGKGNGSIYTRIRSFPTPIPEDPTIEELTEAMVNTWKSADPQVIKRAVQDVVASVIEPRGMQVS